MIHEKKRKIVVLHAAGAPSHYLGLERYAQRSGCCVVYRETNFLRSMAAGILRRDKRRFFKAFVNLAFCIRLALGLVNIEAIVVGFAPYDWRPLIFVLGFKGRRVFLHSSWPNWDATDMPMGNSAYIKNLWERQFLPQLAGIFFVTDHARQSFSRKHRMPDITSVVYHSYLPELYFPRHRSARSDILKLGFAGRLVASKGLAEIIGVAEKLKSKSVEIRVAGDGPGKSKIESEAMKRELKILCLGRLTPSEVGVFFREIDILLLPSIRTQGWEEAFGMVIVEAMACGVIPLVTNHAGPIELLKGINSGWIFGEDEYVIGTTAVINTYLVNPQALQRDKEICITEAEKYTTDRIADRWSVVLACSASETI